MVIHQPASSSNQTEHAPNRAEDKLTSHHFSAVLRASDGQELWSADELLAAIKESVSEAELTAVADVSASFRPQGVSAVIVLEESHVAVHLWPERKLATVDIHVCDYSAPNEPKAMRLAQALGRRIAGDDSTDNWSHLTISG